MKGEKQQKRVYLHFLQQQQQQQQKFYANIDWMCKQMNVARESSPFYGNNRLQHLHIACDTIRC